jgi:hypothetical protein
MKELTHIVRRAGLRFPSSSSEAWPAGVQPFSCNAVVGHLHE